MCSKIVSIAEPIESPKTPSEEMVKTPEERSKNQLTPTINEENELDEPINNNSKSSLSLPVEAPPSGPVERDRRKLSVQGLMAFAERRRSSSTFSDMRKMSVSNGDGIHVRSPGGIGNFRLKFQNAIDRSFKKFILIKQPLLEDLQLGRDHHQR